MFLKGKLLQNKVEKYTKKGEWEKEGAAKEKPLATVRQPRVFTSGLTVCSQTCCSRAVRSLYPKILWSVPGEGLNVTFGS